MNKSASKNALIASLYIVFVVFIVDKVTSSPSLEETLLMPITMLSLLVLSVVVMGILFFYKPLVLLSENRKKEAGALLAKTLVFFSLFVVIIILVFSLFYSQF